MAFSLCFLLLFGIVTTSLLLVLALLHGRFCIADFMLSMTRPTSSPPKAHPSIPRIVIITSIAVAATAAAVSVRFDTFAQVGGIIGTSVSAAFLIILGVMNFYILLKLIRQMRILINAPLGREEDGFRIEGAGCLFWMFRRMFKLIDRYVVLCSQILTP